MLNKTIRYAVVAIVVLLAAYNSVYFRKLDEVKAAANKQFNAASYAKNYLYTKLNPSVSTLTGIDSLVNDIKTAKTSAFATYGHALDIGNIRYFMTKGSGLVTNVDESDIYILTRGKLTIKIATEYVFGNALRDASGLIRVNDFSNTADLNNISSEINKIVRTTVLPSFKSSVKKGDKITFAGAFELNSAHVNLDNIEVIPFILKTNHQ